MTYESGGVGAVEAEHRNGGLHVAVGRRSEGPGLRDHGDPGRGPDGSEERLSREHGCGNYWWTGGFPVGGGKGRCEAFNWGLTLNESSTPGLCSGMDLLGRN